MLRGNHTLRTVIAALSVALLSCAALASPTPVDATAMDLNDDETSTLPLLVTPTALDFGEVPFTNVSDPQSVTVTNTSLTTVPVDVDGGGDIGPFAVTNDCAGAELAPDESCSFTYRYVGGRGASAETSTVTFRSAGGYTRTAHIGLSGTGVPNLSITGGAINFNQVTVGTDAEPQSVVVRNLGTAPAALDTFLIGPNGFTMADQCDGITLAPGATCDITFGFHPTAEGAVSENVQLHVHQGGLTESRSIPLVGIGAPGAPTAGYRVSSGAFEFGNVPVGASSPVQRVVVTNISGTTQHPNFFSSDGVEFGGTTDCDNVTLAPGASCTLDYQFRPVTTGRVDRNTSITIDSTLGSQFFRFTLTGNGLRPFLVSPTALDFGDVPLGHQAPAQTAFVKNVSGVPIDMDGALGASPGFPNGHFCQVDVLYPGSACQMDFGFTPAAVGPVTSSAAGYWMVGDYRQDFTISITGNTPVGNRSFVIAAYTDLLYRAPTADELRAALAALGDGTWTRAQLVNALATSDEHLPGLVSSLYRDLLGRTGESAGVAYWVDQIRSRHRSVASTVANVYASEEYFQGPGGGTDTAWLTDLYRKVLNRSPDARGSSYWLRQITVTNRSSVAVRIYQSAESVGRRVDLVYEALVGRGSDPPAWDYWRAHLPTEGELRLVRLLAPTDEYVAQAQRRFP